MSSWAAMPLWKTVLSLSEASVALLSATSKGVQAPALLVLEDGTVFKGRSCGAAGEVTGEACFNTSIEGYLEVLTDPSYAGQVIAMTYPQIGNYGVSLDDVQRAQVFARGLVVRDLCSTPSSWRSEMTLAQFLCERGIVAIEGVDTRALVRHLREKGAMTCVLSTEDLDVESLRKKVAVAPVLQGQNLVKDVSAAPMTEQKGNPASHAFAKTANPTGKHKVVAYDCGIKESILGSLAAVGCEVECVAWDTPAEDVLAMDPDGVFLSNGPGDPDAVRDTSEAASALIGQVPLFGICLGHQMMGLAAGGDAVKLAYGHRGGNHPVMNLLTGQVEVTSQNHGFAIRFESLGPLIPEMSGGRKEHESDLRVWARAGISPVVQNSRFGRIRLSHVSLNDGTLEGMEFMDVPAFCVQYHPESCPGPSDSRYLFQAFARLMDGDAQGLKTDITAMRLAGWRLGGEVSHAEA